MKEKFKAWFNKKTQQAIWIHKDKKSRIKFKWLYIGILLTTFCLFLISIVMFSFYGLGVNADETVNTSNFYPYFLNKGHIYFLIIGIMLFIIAVVVAILIPGLYYPILYKESRILYMNSNEYTMQVSKYKKEDLSKFKVKDLKWFQKLGWINKLDYALAITKINSLNKNKINKHETQ